ncbi:hypothetical protein JTB14_006933 [Gonioctena quinquepunctata]|nr:hypothetical protein JTB14_006933 [Gonioctena quinquepunctata]
MAQKIKANRTSDNDDIELELDNISSIFPRPVNETEIIQLINNLIDDSAPEFDNIRTKTLKNIAPMIVIPLCYLINLIFAHRKCPKHFKIAVVELVHEKGDLNRVALTLI